MSVAVDWRPSGLTFSVVGRFRQRGDSSRPVARGIVIFLMAEAMLEDHQGESSAEIVGSVSSLLHFVLRHSMKTNLKIEIPLTKLGGPMSIVDVACAILLVFWKLHCSPRCSFSAVGRLLSALLLR